MKSNIERLRIVADALEELVNDVVFVGGSVAELYVDNPSHSDIRSTFDIDCVIEISTRLKYHDFELLLRQKGFRHAITPGAPICRWNFCGIAVDIMPIDAQILGFTNQWYREGVVHKIIKCLSDGTKIFVFATPYYLGTKFEAMNSRRGRDLRTSHDFEDIIYILDNVDDITAQIEASALDIRQYLSQQFHALLINPNIEEVISCALPYGAEERVNYILEILKIISGNNN